MSKAVLTRPHYAHNQPMRLLTITWKASALHLPPWPRQSRVPGRSLGNTAYRGHDDRRSLSSSTLPQPSSTQHHDLHSFLAYAERTGLDATSKTYVGTRYEYVVREALQRMGMTLMRTGGRDDHGIDLLGEWRLPLGRAGSTTRADGAPSTSPAPSQADAPTALKVLLQCKALAGKALPSQARELEGAIIGAPVAWRGDQGNHVLAFLVSTQPSTKGVRDALSRSRWPLGYISCSNTGHIVQILWNRCAEEHGLAGLAVETRYEGKDQTERGVVLTWRGEVLELGQPVRPS